MAGSCLDTILCCIRRPTGTRLFYEEKEERGIEYDRLIELSESGGGGAGLRGSPVVNERERHLISNGLYSEYAEDQKRIDRIREEELLKDEEQLAAEEERYYSDKADRIRGFYNVRPSATPTSSTITEPSATTTIATAEAEGSFADFETRFPRPALSSPGADDQSSVITTRAVNVTSSEIGEISSPPAPPIAAGGDGVVLSIEDSDRLLRDIDLVLQSVHSDDDDLGDDFVIPDDDFTPMTDLLTELGSTTEDFTGTSERDTVSEYFLTNVDLTPSPPADDCSRVTAVITSSDTVVTSSAGSRDRVLDGVAESSTGDTFDPFTEFKAKPLPDI